MAFDVHPVTKERWADLVELFDRPIVRTCFCMFYRKTGSGTGAGVENRQAMKAYDRAGFREVARRRPRRPVVRRALRPERSATAP